LLKFMLDGRMSHCQLHAGTEDMPLIVHIALVMDIQESAKLATHLDRVTQIAIHKHNARRGGSGV